MIPAGSYSCSHTPPLRAHEPNFRHSRAIKATGRDPIRDEPPRSRSRPEANSHGPCLQVGRGGTSDRSHRVARSPLRRKNQSSFHRAKAMAHEIFTLCGAEATAWTPLNKRQPQHIYIAMDARPGAPPRGKPPRARRGAAAIASLFSVPTSFRRDGKRRPARHDIGKEPSPGGARRASPDVGARSVQRGP